MQRPQWIRFATFLVWLLAAGCVVYWALKFVRGPIAPVSAAVAAPAAGISAVDSQALAKGLGGGKTPASNSPTDLLAAPSAFQASRFVLTGVAAQKSKQQGVALIAVDGKPPRPYRVGSQLADGVVLHSVSPGKAMLAASADAAPSLTLELPQLTTALAGTAVAARPAMPAMPAAISMPSASQNPMAVAATALSATMAANPTPVPGQKPPRPLANRQREAGSEARDQAAQ